jgi:hypothetical protein
MSVFKEFSPEDIKTSKSFLNQLVDIVNTDISSSATRRKYQVFVTGGLGPGVTSSLFQTVFDQDFTLQTANAVLDMTVGLASGSEIIQDISPTVDSNGKYLFGSDTLMMREKMDIYRLFAQNLLGDPDAEFTVNNTSTEFTIREPLFICFKRLFARDQIKRETFALRYNPTGALSPTGGNLDGLGTSTTLILTDVNAASNKLFTFGGEISTIVDSAATSNPLGVLFIDRGVLVMDMSRSFDQTQPLSGAIDAITATGIQANFTGSIKEFLVSASIDDIVDHLASTRFSGSDDTAITFQNVTNINSSLFFSRMTADEFNYSSNPTYVDSAGRIVVIDEGQEETQKSFTFISSVGLYDASDNLLAVAKVSRPVLKDSERDLTVKVRLDY